ncbi:MAG: LCP family protein [Nocardioidaceae bacterium]|nr:LCP family protein [Nocardioidaceae bacterium]NUS52920.1 LCP family protein [Nocardioidaceae bacterium]
MSEGATAHSRGGWIGRHKAATILLLLVVLLLGTVAAWATYLNSQISHVPRIDVGIKPPSEDNGGESSPSSAGRGLNILLAGTDTRNPGELQKLVQSGWQPGSMRSDTIMVLHLTADRKKAYLISIPRDTWTSVPGYGHQKINAAFSFGGPKLYVQTIQDFTGLHIDHLAVIDWTGFKNLSSAVGGVDVNVPQTVTDPTNRVTWPKGIVHLEGQRALDYVRMRHGLPNGDFDRIARQQNFLRAMMGKILSSGTMTNPIRLTKTVHTMTAQLTVDSGFTNGRMRDLAFSLRHLRTRDVTFVTLPLKAYGRIDGQSVVLVDQKKSEGLFGAAAADELSTYLAKNDGSVLPAPGQVR